MKVSNQNPPATQLNTDKAEAARKNELHNAGDVAAKKAGKEISRSAGSSVEISDDARLMSQAREIAHREEPNRADRISDLKRQIREGSYKVDSAAVADRLVDSHLLDNFGENSL